MKGSLTACGTDCDSPVPHPREGGDTDVLFAVEDERIVLDYLDAVRNDAGSRMKFTSEKGYLRPHPTSQVDCALQQWPRSVLALAS